MEEPGPQEHTEIQMIPSHLALTSSFFFILLTILVPDVRSIDGTSLSGMIGHRIAAGVEVPSNLSRFLLTMPLGIAGDFLTCDGRSMYGEEVNSSISSSSSEPDTTCSDLSLARPFPLPDRVELDFFGSVSKGCFRAVISRGSGEEGSRARATGSPRSSELLPMIIVSVSFGRDFGRRWTLRALVGSTSWISGSETLLRQIPLANSEDIPLIPPSSLGRFGARESSKLELGLYFANTVCDALGFPERATACPRVFVNTYGLLLGRR
jgi:hypothetical protein